MKLRSIVELTPLLDVFLIIIFAFMINNRETVNEKQLDLELQKHENTLLSLEIENKDAELKQYKENLDSSQIRVLQYERELKTQKKVLDNTLAQVNEKMSLFFEEEKLELKRQNEEGDLTELDYQNFLERVEKIELQPSASFVEQVYILGELNAYATTISIYLSDSNAIWIDRTPAGISLNKFNEETGTFNPELVSAFNEELYSTLKEFYAQRKKGDNKLGEVVLFTFGHANEAMRGVIQESEKTIERFYQETLQNEGGYRKIFFSNFGFYPFQTTNP